MGTVPPRLLEILVCPRCKGGLDHVEDPESLDCRRCRLRFRVDAGVPVMLVDEAVPLPGAETGPPGGGPSL